MRPEERAAGAFQAAVLLPGKDVNACFVSFYLDFFQENHRCLQGNRWQLYLFCVTEALGSVCVALGKLLPLCAPIFS